MALLLAKAELQQLEVILKHPTAATATTYLTVRSHLTGTPFQSYCT